MESFVGGDYIKDVFYVDCKDEIGNMFYVVDVFC